MVDQLSHTLHIATAKPPAQNAKLHFWGRGRNRRDTKEYPRWFVHIISHYITDTAMHFNPEGKNKIALSLGDWNSGLNLKESTRKNETKRKNKPLQILKNYVLIGCQAGCHSELPVDAIGCHVPQGVQ